MQAITVAAAIVTIITGFIAITQYLGGISSEPPLVITNEPPKIDILTTDKLSPQNAGDIITWMAKATDPEGDLIQYKFLLNGNPVTDWSSQSSWIWSGTKTYTGENQIKVIVRDGNHESTDSYDDSKLEDFKIIEAIRDSSPPTTSYTLTNEYAKDSVEPTCVPGSKQASCSSPDSCVDCNGACWSPGSYDNGNSGKSICSGGKWTIIKNKAYSRTNEYTVDSLEPTCLPESKQATCSSSDSCVDCNGECWPPGSYDNGKKICSHGKWTIF